MTINRITLVRHATTDANINGLFVGQVDPPLNARGLLEAEAVAQRLSLEPIHRILSSDLARAEQTAAAIAAHHEGLAIQLDKRLREMHLGDLDGLAGEVVRRDYPELMETWKTNAATAKMPGPGGESLESVLFRAWPCVEETLRPPLVPHTVIVSHTFTLLTCLCRAIGLELNRFRHLFVRPASISEFELHPHGPVLVRLNDTHHLHGQRSE